MAFANSSITDIVATAIQNRSGEIADNVTNNCALLYKMRKRGKPRYLTGGDVVLEEISFAQNTNGGWYSGYDMLPVGPADVISAAQFSWKQYAVPVTISGLEKIQNSGKEKIIDLLDKRLGVAESTMMNDLCAGAFSDGTGSGGKQVVGLKTICSTTPTSGVFAGIDRANFPFWRNQIQTTTLSAANVQATMNTLWAKCVRNTDVPDLISAGGTAWGFFVASLQNIQRITDPEMAKLGFTSLKFMSADVVLDGGIGGQAVATDMYFVNTKFLFWRPAKDRDMVPLDPQKRSAINQDAEVSILAWAGAMTSSGCEFQGRLNGA